MRSRHVVYGDFNCPYSYLASLRCDALLAEGVIDVEWRAIEHDPTVPRSGQPVEGDAAARLAAEIGEVVSLAAPGDRFPISMPRVLPNTAFASAVFAGCHGRDAAGLRGRLFAALWRDGRNLGEWMEVDRVLVHPFRANFRQTETWRQNWRLLGAPAVPTIVLPVGIVLEGKEALEYLASRQRTATRVRD